MNQPLLRSLLLPAMLLCMVMGEPAHAQVQGTLFTSPEQRAYMDFLRQEFLSRSTNAGFDIEVPEIPEFAATDATGTEVPEGPTEFTLGGILTGRDGTRSVWLNNNLLHESELPDWVRIITSGESPILQLNVNGSRWELRPGQTVDLASGTVSEAYQRPPPEEAPAVTEGIAALVGAVTDTTAETPTETTAEVLPGPESADVSEAAPAPTIPADTTAAVLPERPLEELDATELDALIESLQERRADLDED